MINSIIASNEFKNISKKHIKDVIDFLVENDYEFAITANINGIIFVPMLPKTILEKLSIFSLFILSNYTFSTVEINDEFLSFEAGFGKENFGSTVKIPLLAIFQIICDESILYINSIATSDDFIQKEKQLRNSIEIFKNNPKNKKFLANK